MNGTASRTRVTVEAILDIACVWSYLAYTRFARAASRFRADGGEVTVAFRPFQVEPDAPVDGGPLADELRRRFGPDVERRKSSVTALGTAAGLRLDFDRAVRTNTFAAHLLVASAVRVGRAEPMVERLFRAHFTDGLNVGDRRVLARLAAQIGVPQTDTGEDGLRAELDRVRMSGVTGVPVFRRDPGIELSGLQSEDTYLRVLRSED